MLGRDALFIEGIEAVNFILLAANLKSRAAVEAVHE
jgi:hypothetical protein